MPRTATRTASRPLASLWRSLLLVTLGALIVSAQTVSFKARPLSPSEIAESQAQLAPSAVKGIAGPLRLDEKQAFAVEGENLPAFSLMPVRYNAHDEVPGHTTFRCGIFFLSRAGKTVFLATAGYNWTETVQCTALEGVGFLAAADTRTPPRILLLYAVNSANAASQEPFVLDWSSRQGQYIANEKLSRRLEDDDKATGIPAMKKQLNSYR